MKRLLKKCCCIVAIMLFAGIPEITNAQSCARFLGGDKMVISCESGFRIDFNELFVTDAVITAEVLEPKDTIYNNGVPTIRYYASKTKIVATNGFGCKDSAIVRVNISQLPVPNIGPDKFIAINEKSTINISNLFTTGTYTKTWSVSNPETVGRGVYQLVVKNADGCTDTGLVTICYKPINLKDTTAYLCAGETINLNEVHSFSFYSISWNTTNITNAGVGSYTATIKDPLDGCASISETKINVAVNSRAKPGLGADKTAEVCSGKTTNITTLFNTTGLTTSWIPSNPATATQGVYTLIAKNSFGCADTALVKINEIKRTVQIADTAIDVCGTVYDLTKLFNLPGITKTYSASNPSKAALGSYTITITDKGCEYTVAVELKAGNFVNEEQLNLCNYNRTTTNNIFTTNAFRSIIVDKRGQVWAGADLGGLYLFKSTVAGCAGGTWQKSTVQPNTTYRNFVLGPTLLDSTVWVSNIGHTGVQAITGGVLKITDFDNIQRYGSTDDPNGTLSSRFVSSIAATPNGSILAALTQATTGTTTKEGGAFILGTLDSDRKFAKIASVIQTTSDIKVNAVGNKENEAWFAVQNSCVSGVCKEPYIARYNTITNTLIGFIDKTNSPIPFSTNLIVRAIKSAYSGRMYVGLNTGYGFAVLEPNLVDGKEQWHLIDNTNSPFPAGAAVNFNAITNIADEIWIGTTAGLLVFNGEQDLTDCKNYKLYTTANGLPSNNITSIAYDKFKGEIWLTHSEGVSRIVKEKSVSGKILNVYTGKINSLLVPNLIKRPIEGVKVELLAADNSVKETQQTNAEGFYKMTEGLPDETYKLRISYNSSRTGINYKYEIANIKTNQLVEDLMMPDSLIADVKFMGQHLKKLDLKIDLPLGAYMEGLITLPTNSLDGLDTTGLYKSYSAYSTVLKNDINKRAENLAVFYNTISSIYEMGNKTLDLSKATSENAAELVVQIYELISLFKKAGEAIEEAIPKKITEENQLAEFFKTALSEARGKAIGYLMEKLQKSALAPVSTTNDAGTALLKRTLFGLFNQVVSQILVSEKDTKNEMPIANLTKDDLIKMFAKYLTSALTNFLTEQYYDEYFAGVVHKDVIKELAIACDNLDTDLLYNNAYTINYRPLPPLTDNPQSVNYRGQLLVEDAEQYMLAMKTISDITSQANTAFDVASKLAASTVVLAEFAPVFQTLSKAMSAFNVVSYLGSITGGMVYLSKVTDLSKEIRPNSGLGLINVLPDDNHLFEQLYLDNIQLQSDVFTQKLQALKQATTGSFNRPAYFKALKDVFYQDSVLKSRLNEQYNIIMSVANNNSANVHLLNDYIHSDFNYNHDRFGAHSIAMYVQLHSYILDSAKTGTIKSDLVAYIDSMMYYLPKMLSGYEVASAIVNNNKLPAESFIALKDIRQNFDYKPNSVGKTIYTFKNYSSKAATNVVINISTPTNGFVLTSAKTIQIGNVAPGDSFNVVLDFKAPNDYIDGMYQLKIEAAAGYMPPINGSWQTVKATIPGEIRSVKNGLWSDINTWNTKTIPVVTSNVFIEHQVTMDVNAEVKSVNILNAAQLRIDKDRKLNLKQ